MNQEDNLCPVCYNRIFIGNDNESNFVKLLCGHKFHFSCLIIWLRTNRTCPSCRSDLEEQPIIPIGYEGQYN